MVNFEEMWKVHDISDGTFSWKILTSQDKLEFHMQVSVADSINIFRKFDEIWWTLRRFENFIIFLGLDIVSIFTLFFWFSLNELKFHMHVSDNDFKK